jgi:hypothetical protein
MLEKLVNSSLVLLSKFLQTYKKVPRKPSQVIDVKLWIKPHVG